VVQWNSVESIATALQIAYIALVALVVEGKALQLNWLEYSTKPLLMPVLAAFLWALANVSGRTATGPTLSVVLVALAFAWLGDVFLMFDRGFAPGLAAFFVMQCAYIYMLWPARTGVFTRPANLAPAILISASFLIQYSLVQGNLGAIRLPAIVYFCAFSVTMFLAAARYIDSPTATNATILLGVALFYVSDCLIALSTFHRPFPLSGPAILLTYAAGQYLFLTSYARE
jgi:uncharacterized membrane protein YhhN